jgi:hypothetical protein
MTLKEEISISFEIIVERDKIIRQVLYKLKVIVKPVLESEMSLL